MNTREIVRTVYRALVVESIAPALPRVVATAALSEIGESARLPEHFGQDPERDGEWLTAHLPVQGFPWGVARAMARAVRDPHTMLFSEAQGRDLMALVSGDDSLFPGFLLQRAAGGPWVVSDVLEGSPAETASLAVGDVVSAIDGLSVERGIEDVLDMMGQPEGAPVHLSVTRGTTARRVELRLKRWSPPPLRSSLAAPGIAHLKFRFVTTSKRPERDSRTLLERRIRELVAQGANSIVLDLRGNTGGYGVTRVASLLTAADPIAVYRDASGSDEVAVRVGEAIDGVSRIVVLIDEQTMSSAEMIALALRDHGVAQLVGQPTAGALNVPRLLKLPGGHMLMTPERRALTPRSRSALAGMRLVPDVLVPNPDADARRAGRDPQLEAALACLAA